MVSVSSVYSDAEQAGRKLQVNGSGLLFKYGERSSSSPRLM